MGYNESTLHPDRPYSGVSMQVDVEQTLLVYMEIAFFDLLLIQ